MTNPDPDKLYKLDGARFIDALSTVCEEIANLHGFDEDHQKLADLLEAKLDPENPRDARLLEWFESTVEQAEIARIHSEASEWLESVRASAKTPDKHLPEFLSTEVEAADILIRVMHSCKKRDYRLGEAFFAKLRYNLSRPYKHGKNS